MDAEVQSETEGQGIRAFGVEAVQVELCSQVVVACKGIGVAGCGVEGMHPSERSARVSCA